MSKHTPGPLIADGYNVRQPNGRHCAYTGPHHTPPNEYPAQCRREDEANAVLYAAAPDLLAGLKAMVAAFDATGERLYSLSGGPTSRDIAVAAIAKAEGRA